MGYNNCFLTPEAQKAVYDSFRIGDIVHGVKDGTETPPGSCFTLEAAGDAPPAQPGNLIHMSGPGSSVDHYYAFASGGWYYLSSAFKRAWFHRWRLPDKKHKLFPSEELARDASMAVIKKAREGKPIVFSVPKEAEPHVDADYVTDHLGFAVSPVGDVSGGTVICENPVQHKTKVHLARPCGKGWVQTLYLLSDAMEIVESGGDIDDDADGVEKEGNEDMADKKITLTDEGVVRTGKKVIVPEGMSIDRAIKALERQKKFEEEITSFSEVIETFPWDGAYAFREAMRRTYGFAEAETQMTWFGPVPPALISVPISPTETVNVPWGKFTLPNIDGELHTAQEVKQGRFVFKIVAEVKRKHEAEIKALADLTRTILKTESIYRGKALKVKMTPDPSERGKPPMPKPLDVSKASADRLVFCKDVSDVIGTCLYEPIESYRELPLHGIPYKRGILLAGTYGVGKSELAFVAARKAVENGQTFILCEDPAEFASVVLFAMHYAPAVIFCEDIDRVTSGGRSEALDAILNTVDGLESKGTDIMVVLTTNHVENINKAMLRPGRLDAVIEIKRPDADAVERLIRLYSNGLLDPAEDISAAAALLRGQIPAVIREVVERGKLAQLRLSRLADTDMELTGEALLIAAESMKMQMDLLAREPEPSPTELENVGRIIGETITEGALAVMGALDGEDGVEHLDVLDGKRQGVREAVAKLARHVTQRVVRKRRAVAAVAGADTSEDVDEEDEK